VKTRFQSLPFKCNLQRYIVGAYDVSGVVAAAEAAGVLLHPDGFDGIALLNVLDRCDNPFTLLAQLRAMLRPGSGRLVLAVVVPFRPFVVGLYKLNSVDSWLASAWFQPLSLSSEKPVFLSLLFKFSLYRLRRGGRQDAPRAQGAFAAAVQRELGKRG
jgi:hypothetical protein